MAKIDPIKHVDVPSRIPRSWGLGLLFENALTRFIVDVFNRVKTAFADMLRYAVETTLDALEPHAITVLRPFIARAFDNDALPEEVRALGAQLLSGEHQVEAALLIPVAIGLLMSVVRGAFDPFVRLAAYFGDRLVKSARLDPGTAIHARWRSGDYSLLAEGDLHDLGWSDERIAAAELVAKDRLGIGDLLRLWRREEITDSELHVRAGQAGFDLTEMEDLKKATRVVPGPGDLVRFALREAWRDDVAARWGYDQARVPEFGEWMTKQGLSEDWAKRYWRSHWVVPGVDRGFEMMWREVISESELEELLKINDVAPGWIPYLMKVARPVPGRIDRRYAAREGEIGWQELFDLYKFDGYDDFWAEILANTTMKMAVGEAKGLTRAAIEKAYRKQRIRRREAVEMLSDIGILAEVANFYLDQVDADRADDLLERRIDAVEKQFVVGDLTESQARDELSALQVPATEVEVYVEEWSVTKSTKVKRPSRTNLDKFFREGIITVAQYRAQLDALGFSGLYVDWYLASLAIERQQIVEKEEREVRAEAERIEKARRKTDYQVAKSRIDVDIAELQAAIASAQVALVEAENERDRKLELALSASEIAVLEREYQPLLFDADAAISESRLEIARLQTAIREKREAVSLIDRSLIENVDMLKYATLRADRLKAQTEQARLGELIAASRVAIAELKEAIAAFTEARDVDVAKSRILELQTEIAKYAEDQASWVTAIEEIDELMSAELESVRRSELESQKSAYLVDIAALEVEIAGLREEIRSVQREREALELELEAKITALPGADTQIAIKSEYRTLISKIESNITSYRENIARLRVEKSELAVGYRERS